MAESVFQDMAKVVFQVQMFCLWREDFHQRLIYQLHEILQGPDLQGHKYDFSQLQGQFMKMSRLQVHESSHQRLISKSRFVKNILGSGHESSHQRLISTSDIFQEQHFQGHESYFHSCQCQFMNISRCLVLVSILPFSI